jgi:hypothetical protein
MVIIKDHLEELRCTMEEEKANRTSSLKEPHPDIEE